MNSRESLPMMLSANDIQTMGFTRTMVYSLFKREDLPAVKIGKRLFVQRDKFFVWLEKQEVVAKCDSAQKSVGTLNYLLV